MKQIVYLLCLFTGLKSMAQLPTRDTSIHFNKTIGEAGNASDFDMAPETRIEVVQAAADVVAAQVPAGPVQPNWPSLQAYYQVPAWYAEAKFGLCMHWGLYSVPAYHNEWYEKHMYGSPAIAAWHVKHFGLPDSFGYKNFIPLFKAEKFDADAWAELFRQSGARFFMPACQHHDGFALWDSKVTPYNAMQMGPHRDIIGELAKAVRKRGLKFGFTNHQVENFQFINPPRDMLERMKAARADLFDPAWVNFYNVADRSDSACKAFLVNWFNRNVELINQYQPDMLWFDNGIDQRYLDPIKLQLAAYYYNTAKQWGKQVSLNTKKAAFAPSGTNIATIGSILDFEGRAPAGIRTGVWDVDTQIGSTWGYTTDMRVAGAGAIVTRLIDIVSKNGTMMLNLSPKADGTIPQEQQETLLGVGRWLQVNGSAIYGTHNWIKAQEEGTDGNRVYFTVKADTLYAIITGKWPAGAYTIHSLPVTAGKATHVSLLGTKQAVNFSQDSNGLTVVLPTNAPCTIAYTLQITGLPMNASTITASGNPIPGYPYQ